MQPLTLVGHIGRTPAEPRAKPPAIYLAADDKAFRTLVAEFALAGSELIDEVGIDGACRLYVVRDGKTEHLGSIDAARAALAQIAAH